MGAVATIEVLTYSIRDSAVRQTAEGGASRTGGSTAYATNPHALKTALDTAIRRILDAAAEP